MFFRFVLRVCILSIFLSLISSTSSNASITWNKRSEKDSRYDGTIYNAKYDLEYLEAVIFDNDPDKINFYMDFLEVPTVSMFNDGLDSWAYFGLDYDLDDKRDIMLIIDKLTLKSDLYSVSGKAYNANSKTFLNCSVEVFTNIDARKKWVAVEVSRKCLGIPLVFELSGYAEHNVKTYRGTDSGSWDYAPNPAMRVYLPGSTTPTTPSSTIASSGATYALPQSIANSSTESRNFTSPPSNLSALSESLLPSVVTVKCLSGSGTGWSADSALSQPMKDAGFSSLIVTNHHVVEDCLGTKSVNLLLSNGTTISGQVVSWNKDNDVAGIVTKTNVPSLQWVGVSPKQGWWVGVLGSPLGKANVLTTGIISSVNQNTKIFTLTAAINPGNSGGPVFDNTGRVLGLATSKALLSDGQLSEGFGNAHGVPLLCGLIITCGVESDPWNGKSKFLAGPTAEEIAAQAKAEAEAKAKVEAEAKAKAEAELEAKMRGEMRSRCIDFNGKLELAIFNANSAKLTYPSSSSVFGGIVSIAPSALDCDFINVTTFASELQSKERILMSLESSITNAIANAKTNSIKKTTITCVKGKFTKRITAVNPKCPAGYKKK